MATSFPIMAENKQQIEFISKKILKHKAIVLSSPSGSGKQTLVVETLSSIRKKKKKMNIIRVEMAGARKAEDLVRILLHELHNHFFSSRITFIDAWQSWLGDDQMPLYINERILEIVPGKEKEYLQNIYGFLRILVKKTNPFFCWFTGCESLKHWDEHDLFRDFISIIKKISNCYVIVTDAMEYEAKGHLHILESEAVFLPVYPPSHNDWIRWITAKFKSGKINITRTQAGKIADTFSGFPLYTNQFTEWLVSQPVKELGTKEYESGKMEIIERYSPWFNHVLQSLSNTQFSLLRAVSSPELKYTSVRVMQKYQLGTPRNVAKNLETLQRNGIIRMNGKVYEFTDPAFQAWFKMNFM